MKTRWQFRFNAWGMFFESKHKFVGKLNGKKKGLPSTEEINVPFELQLVPDDKCPPSGPDATGKVLITLPGSPETTEEYAHLIASQIQEKICFSNGRFEIHSGIIVAERIPETPEEKEAVGDQPYYVNMAIQEVPEVPPFDPKRLSSLQIRKEHAPLLKLFNSVRQLENPVDRFLGFFKVLEKAYADGRGGNLLRALQENKEFFAVASAVLRPSSPGEGIYSKEEFDLLLRNLIRIRDNCAHLRGKTGYAPGDPRIRVEVEPNVPLLEEFAARCIADEGRTRGCGTEPKE